MLTSAGSPDLGGYGFKMFSFTSNYAIDRAKDFISRVLNRYQNLIGRDLLFVAPTVGTSQELEYSHGYQLDYSPQMISAFQNWYRSQFPNEPVPSRPPTHFSGTEGRRWYAFRHKMLKGFLEQMTNHVKSIHSGIRVVADYGSVFDALSQQRGTLAFKDIGQGTDGIKVNDDYNYDHRFSMDMLRSNLPGKWIMNEVLPHLGNVGYLRDVYNFGNQSFAHGAKLFSVVTGNKESINHPEMQDAFKRLAREWIDGDRGHMQELQTSGRIDYTFEDMMRAMYQGNRFRTQDRDFYGDWLNQLNQSGGRPVHMNYDDRAGLSY